MKLPRLPLSKTANNTASAKADKIKADKKASAKKELQNAAMAAKIVHRWKSYLEDGDNLLQG